MARHEGFWPNRAARVERVTAHLRDPLKLVRYADRPDLRAIRFETLSQRTFPGAKVAASESMTMESPVTDWEAWTGMPFLEDGTYVFPGALAPLEVRNGVGRHVEPNVWVLHSV